MISRHLSFTVAKPRGAGGSACGCLYGGEKLAKLERQGAYLIVAVRRELALRVVAGPAEVLLFANGTLLKELLPRLEAFGA
ncbi:MAG: hypothetical protein QN183_09150 [Armatimonadota bacterium]|nr:hypothetical protein [Armatimonadota bacterium]MDR7485234.1 hypothetical protein [Armatimonadota bacterium]MDR7533987.1 hypothetical protein [Armatimonadota bacterium]MDR7536518.1 hypothetical protein [Armatimonadota bacterium]